MYPEIFKRLNAALRPFERILFYSIIVLGLAVMVGLIILSFNAITGNIVATTGQTVAEYAGLVLLIANGTLLKTTYWRIIRFAFGIATLALMFIIMHLPGGREILIVCYSVILITYSIRFVMKRNRVILDWTKFLWIFSWLTLALVANFITADTTHWLFDMIPAVIFWITLAVFARDKINPSSLAQKNVG